MPRQKQTAGRAAKGTSRRSQTSSNSGASFKDLLQDALGAAGGARADFASLAGQLLPGFGGRMLELLNDRAFKRELAVGTISILIDLYGAAQEHRKRMLETEERLHALLRDALRRLPPEPPARRRDHDDD